MPRSSTHPSRSFRPAVPVALAGLVLVLAGCGGEAGTDSGSGSGAGSGAGETITLTYTTMLNEHSAASEAFQVWMDEVTEATDGRVRFDAYYDNSLCAAADAFDCLEDGRADLAFDTPAYTPELVGPALGNVGFTTYDYRALGAAMNEFADGNEVIEKEYADRNQKVLFWQAESPMMLGLADGHAVGSVNELDGKSLRAATQMGIALSLLGVNPVAIPAAEVYESIERGVIQGVTQSIGVFSDLRFYEVAPNAYSFDAVGAYAVSNFAINKNTYDGLPADVQKAMDDASANIVANQTTADMSDAEVVRVCGVFADAGIEPKSLGLDAEGKAWAAAARDRLVADWAEQAKSLIDDPQAYADEFFRVLESKVDPEAPTFPEVCAAQ